MATTTAAEHVRVIEETPAYWRVVFDNPPFNMMDDTVFDGLQSLLARMDASPNLRVVVFESSNRSRPRRVRVPRCRCSVSRSWSRTEIP